MNNQEQNNQTAVNTTPVQPNVAPVEPTVTVQNVQQPVQQPSVNPTPNIAAPNVQATAQPAEPAAPVIAGPNLQAASLTNLSNVGDSNTQVKEQMSTQNTANIAAVTTSTSTTDQIAQGIKDGSFVNAINDPNALMSGKVGSTISSEDEIMAKKAKKNAIRFGVILLLLIIIGVGGFIFYKKEYTTAAIRIDALIDGLNGYISPIFNDCEKRIGTFDLEVNVTQNTEKYGLHTSGSYGYDLASYMQINGEVDKVISGEELLDKDSIKYYFYINDSKIYVKFEDLFEKFIYTDFEYLDEFFSNINQNDVAYEVAYAQFVSALKAGVKAGGMSQTIGKANINGTSKQVNIVTINLNKNSIANIQNAFFTTLANNTVFVENLSMVSGDTKEDVVKKLNKQATADIKYEGNINIKLYSSILGTEFIGIDVSTTENNVNYLFTVLPVAGGYEFILKENDSKVTDLTYTRTLTAGANNKTFVNNLSGDIYYNKNVYQISSVFKIVIDLPYQEDKPVVRESINVKYLTLDDFENMFNAAKEKYNVVGTELYGYRSNLYSLLGFESPATEETTPTEQTGEQTTTE